MIGDSSDLSSSPTPPAGAVTTVFVVDDDDDLRRSLELLLKPTQWDVRTFGSAQEYLDAFDPSVPGCLLLDLRMPGMSGLELLDEMRNRHYEIATVILSGHADIPLAVTAVKGGALDVLQKPFDREALLSTIEKALDRDLQRRSSQQLVAEVAVRLERLTPREREVFELILEGLTTKQIAAKLEISARTIEKHRERVMKKMEVESTTELILLAVHSNLIGPSGDNPE